MCSMRRARGHFRGYINAGSRAKHSAVTLAPFVLAPLVVLAPIVPAPFIPAPFIIPVPLVIPAKAGIL